MTDHPADATTDRPAARDTGDGPWTTRRLLRWMTDFLEQRGIDAPRLTSEMLLAHVLRTERMRLYMEVDRPASPDEREALRSLVRRVAAHEPVQYLVGEGWFYGRPFLVDATTLIPRPSTETLVQAVLERRPAGADAGADGLRVADVGTGTGCIAISLALDRPGWSVLATDLRADALALARRNAGRFEVLQRIELAEGDGLAPLRDRAAERRFDVLASNPPYVSDAEWASLVGPNVKGHEPESALRGGADGLAVIGPIVAGAADVLVPGGLLAVEVADAHAEAAPALARAGGRYEDVEMLRDGDGYWRVLVARVAG